MFAIVGKNADASIRVQCPEFVAAVDVTSPYAENFGTLMPACAGLRAARARPARVAQAAEDDVRRAGRRLLRHAHHGVAGGQRDHVAPQ